MVTENDCGLVNGALIMAAMNGHAKAAEILINSPQIKFQRDQPGFTCLHWAVKRNHLDVVKVLLAHPMVDINRRDSSGFTPLFVAVREGHADIVSYLLDFDVGRCSDCERKESDCGNVHVEQTHRSSAAASLDQKMVDTPGDKIVRERSLRSSTGLHATDDKQDGRRERVGSRQRIIGDKSRECVSCARKTLELNVHTYNAHGQRVEWSLLHRALSSGQHNILSLLVGRGNPRIRLDAVDYDGATILHRLVRLCTSKTDTLFVVR